MVEEPVQSAQKGTSATFQATCQLHNLPALMVEAHVFVAQKRYQTTTATLLRYDFLKLR